METVLFGVLPVLAFVGLATRSVVRGRRPTAPAVVEDKSSDVGHGHDAPHRQGGK